MLFLVLQLGDDRYVLNTEQIAEILPMVQLTRMPRAPRSVAGAFNYRGTAVPVVDLSQLTLGRPARAVLSTRIVLIVCRDQDGATHTLGVIAERATGTIRLNPADFCPGDITNDNAPYLGPVMADDRGLVRWVDPLKLLPASISARLREEAAGP